MQLVTKVYMYQYTLVLQLWRVSPRPAEYQDKIIAAFLLAPAVFWTFATDQLREDSENWFAQNELNEMNGDWETSVFSPLNSWFGHNVCDEENFPENEIVCLAAFQEINKIKHLRS